MNMFKQLNIKNLCKKTLISSIESHILSNELNLNNINSTTINVELSLKKILKNII